MILKNLIDCRSRGLETGWTSGQSLGNLIVDSQSGSNRTWRDLPLKHVIRYSSFRLEKTAGSLNCLPSSWVTSRRPPMHFFRHWKSKFTLRLYLCVPFRIGKMNLAILNFWSMSCSALSRRARRGYTESTRGSVLLLTTFIRYVSQNLEIPPKLSTTNANLTYLTYEQQGWWLEFCVWSGPNSRKDRSFQLCETQPKVRGRGACEGSFMRRFIFRGTSRLDQASCENDEAWDTSHVWISPLHLFPLLDERKQWISWHGWSHRHSLPCLLEEIYFFGVNWNEVWN